jgi:hypothetical protein
MKTKIHNDIMLTFRANKSLREALEIIAKQNKLSRSSLIRVLLISAIRDNLKVVPKNNRKKPVDTKATA